MEDLAEKYRITKIRKGNVPEGKLPIRIRRVYYRRK
jgi:hypothetical protein